MKAVGDVQPLTSKRILIQADKPWLLFLRLTKSSRNPIVANARVAAEAPKTSTEENPSILSATSTPMGIKYKPPIVGVPFLEEC